MTLTKGRLRLREWPSALNRRCRRRLWKKHKKTVGLQYRCEVSAQATGELESDTGWVDAHSTCEQFIQILRVHAAQTSDTAVVDTGGADGNTKGVGTSRTVAVDTDSFAIDAGAGVVTHGPVCGTGTTSVTQTDEKLNTLIVEGTSSGQMQHQATSISVATSHLAEARVSCTRIILNNSGGTIAVAEVGLYIEGSDNSTAFYFLAARELSSNSVANGSQLTLSWKFYSSDILTLAFFQLLYVQWSQGSASITKVDNTTSSATPHAQSFRMTDAVGGDTGFGIVASSDSTPSAFVANQYAVGSLIPSGSGSGELDYSTMTIRSVASNTQFDLVRSLANNSGATVTIYALALYQGSSATHMLARNVPTAFAVADGATAVIKFSLSIT